MNTNIIRLSILNDGEDDSFKDELLKHIKVICNHYDISVLDVLPFENYTDKLIDNLDNSHVSIFLISASFFDNAFFVELLEKAVIRNHKDGLVLLPVLIRACLWTVSDSLQQVQGNVLPQNHKPIASWKDKDIAYKEIVYVLRICVEYLLMTRQLNALKEENEILKKENKKLKTNDGRN